MEQNYQVAAIDTSRLESRLSRDGKNLKCSCGRWTEQLFFSANRGEAVCRQCLRREMGHAN